MKTITIILALLIAGCYTSGYNLREQGSEFLENEDWMVNYTYADGNDYEDLVGRWYLVKSKETWNGEEIIKGGPYEKGEVECLMELHRKYEMSDGYICTVLK